MAIFLLSLCFRKFFFKLSIYLTNQEIFLAISHGNLGPDARLNKLPPAEIENTADEFSSSQSTVFISTVLNVLSL